MPLGHSRAETYGPPDAQVPTCSIWKRLYSKHASAKTARPRPKMVQRNQRMSPTLTGESEKCYARDRTNVIKVMVRAPGRPYLAAMTSKGHQDSQVGETQAAAQRACSS